MLDKRRGRDPEMGGKQVSRSPVSAWGGAAQSQHVRCSPHPTASQGPREGEVAPGPHLQAPPPPFKLPWPPRDARTVAPSAPGDQPGEAVHAGPRGVGDPTSTVGLGQLCPGCGLCALWRGPPGGPEQRPLPSGGLAAQVQGGPARHRVALDIGGHTCPSSPVQGALLPEWGAGETTGHPQILHP